MKFKHRAWVHGPLMLQEEEKQQQLDAARRRAADEDVKLKAKQRELDRQAAEYEAEMQDQSVSLMRVQVRYLPSLQEQGPLVQFEWRPADANANLENRASGL